MVALGILILFHQSLARGSNYWKPGEGHEFSAQPACVGADAVLLLRARRFTPSPRAPTAPWSRRWVLSAHAERMDSDADVPLEKEIQDVLKADDTLNRVYVSPSQTDYAFLFIAYFRTQRMARRRTLPRTACQVRAGAGGDREADHRRSRLGWPIVTNRMWWSTETTRAWCCTGTRPTTASLPASIGEVLLVVDSIRYRRSDTSLVKVWCRSRQQHRCRPRPWASS